MKKKDKNFKSRNKGCFQLETPNDTEDDTMKEEFKVEKILKGSLDSIPSPSPCVQIQSMGGKLCLRDKG